MTTALRTDLYEFTMVDAALASGVAREPCVFEVFARHLPPGRRYGVAAGQARLVDAVDRFRPDEAALAYVASLGKISREALDFLSTYRFSGSIEGYREGEVYFPHSPVLTVVAPFAEAVVIETLALSILNFDSAVASAASQIVTAAGGKPLIEMGGRRTHEEAAVAAARAAFIAGFESTSNLEAGRLYGLPVVGTVAHSFVLAHGDERSAFEAQARRLGPGTIFLVDTFDVEQGIRNTVAVAGADRLGGVRIDSGDLRREIPRARALLDSLGAPRAKIIASGDLDASRVGDLACLPVDAFGVGTDVVTGGGAPTAGFVYKLVEVAGRPVAKRSEGKATRGGRKVAWRVLDGDGMAKDELAGPGSREPRGRPLQVAFIEDGRPRPLPGVDDLREHHRRALAELPDTVRQPGPPLFESHE